MSIHETIATLAKAGALPPSLQALSEHFVPADDSTLANPLEERKGRLALSLAGKNVIGNFKLGNKVVVENEATWDSLPQNVRFFLSLYSLMAHMTEAQLTQILTGMLKGEILINIDQFSNGDAYMSFSVPKGEKESDADQKKSDKRRRS